MKQNEGKEEEEDSSCCMCGDMGFSDQLLRCPACRTRLQHTYCSRMYPEIEMKMWKCEWCLHEDHEHQQRKRRRQQQQKQAATSTTIIKLKKRHRDFVVGTSSKSTSKKQHLQDSSSSMPGCDSSSLRMGGRRYKLLADVLC